MELKNRFLGCLVGLAVGDAYGTTYEFTNRKRMPAELPDDIIGGGPFDMKPGEWTDDTSMALCLAESIVEKGWDTDDQMKRYIRWWQEGYNSVKGECFDIGGATRSALSCYNMTGNFVIDSQAAGNGVLMRLAPVPMYCYDPDDSVFALSHCAFQSSMTHPSSQSIECSMLMGAIINKILSGERDKMKILHFDTLMDENSKQMYKEVFEKYNCHENGRIESIKKVEYKDYPLEKLSGDGYCVYTLEAALWAFLTTDNFRAGLKKVVALGDDTDTTGAVYGQIAGAYYGINGIPWVEKIAWIEKIKKLAEDLCELHVKSENLYELDTKSDKEIIDLPQEDFDILVDTAKKSTCHRSKCGSIIISNKGELIGVGYNSMPCNENAACFKDSLAPGFKSDKTCCVHAEQRAIMYALANNPEDIKGSLLLFIRLDENDEPKRSGEPYCTICSKMALDAGIARFALWHKEGWTAYETNYYNKLSFEYGKQ